MRDVVVCPPVASAVDATPTDLPATERLGQRADLFRSIEANLRRLPLDELLALDLLARRLTLQPEFGAEPDVRRSSR